MVRGTLKGLALKPKGRQHMDIERRIKVKEREAEDSEIIDEDEDENKG